MQAIASGCPSSCGFHEARVADAAPGSPKTGSLTISTVLSRGRSQSAALSLRRNQVDEWRRAVMRVNPACSRSDRRRARFVIALHDHRIILSGCIFVKIHVKGPSGCGTCGCPARDRAGESGKGAFMSRAHGSIVEPPNREAQMATEAQRHILVADDDAMMCMAIEASLQRSNFRVTFASGGQTGRRVLEQHQFDLMLVDIFMPRMRGFESIRVFHEIAPSVPLIAMSAAEAPWLRDCVRQYRRPRPVLKDSFTARVDRTRAACQMQDLIHISRRSRVI